MSLGAPIPPTTTTTTPTTVAQAAATTVAASSVTVKKAEALPKTGNNTSTLIWFSGVLVAGGLVLALRRRIVQ